MKNFAGYQLNIKYDPTMLEAIELETGSAIAKRTWPVTGGTVLQSDNYGKTTAVANDVGAGIITLLRHTRTLPNTERQVWQRRQV